MPHVAVSRWVANGKIDDHAPPTECSDIFTSEPKKHCARAHSTAFHERLENMYALFSLRLPEIMISFISYSKSIQKRTHELKQFFDAN